MYNIQKANNHYHSKDNKINMSVYLYPAYPPLHILKYVCQSMPHALVSSSWCILPNNINSKNCGFLRLTQPRHHLHSLFTRFPWQRRCCVEYIIEAKDWLLWSHLEHLNNCKLVGVLLARYLDTHTEYSEQIRKLDVVWPQESVGHVHVAMWTKYFLLYFLFAKAYSQTDLCIFSKKRKLSNMLEVKEHEGFFCLLILIKHMKNPWNKIC